MIDHHNIHNILSTLRGLLAEEKNNLCGMG